MSEDLRTASSRDLEASADGGSAVEGRSAAGPERRELDPSSPVIRRFLGRRLDLRDRHGIPHEWSGLAALTDDDGDDALREDLHRLDRVRIAETRLEPGDEVHVVGTVRSLVTPDGSDGPVAYIGRAEERSGGSFTEWMAGVLGVSEYLDRSARHDAIFVVSDEPQDDLVAGRESEMGQNVKGAFVALVLGVLCVGLGIVSLSAA